MNELPRNTILTGDAALVLVGYRKQAWTAS